jgi:hypothetical protein
MGVLPALESPCVDVGPVKVYYSMVSGGLQ